MITSSKPKIAVIGLKGLPAFGGAARVGESLINLLKDKYDFTVYSVSSHTQNSGYYNGYEQIVFKKNKNKKINIFIYYLKSAFHCLIKGNYDLIQVHHTESGFIIPFLRIKFKIIATSHGIPQAVDKWSKIDKMLFSVFEYVFLKFSSVIISVSEANLTRYSRKTNKPIFYIPNGVNLDETYDKNYALHGYLFFAANRIIKIKGCHTLLKALHAMNYNGKLLIAGSLEHISDYKKDILELSKGLDVQFLGLIKEKKELMTLLKNANLFIFPSSVEAMSSMLLEAASMQVPIVCSDIENNRAIFNDDEILFFQAGNPEDLCEKIKWTFANRNEMITKAANAFAKLSRLYTWPTIADKYSEIYDNALKKS